MGLRFMFYVLSFSLYLRGVCPGGRRWMVVSTGFGIGGMGLGGGGVWVLALALSVSVSVSVSWWVWLGGFLGYTPLNLNLNMRY